MRFGSDLRPEEIAVMRRVSGLPVNVSAMAVMTNIWRAAQALRAVAEQTVLGEYDLTWASFSSLYIVWIWGPIETRELARSQGVSRATISSTVDTLQRRGLVRRTADGVDRRLVSVELTPEGQAVIEAAYPRFNRLETAIVANLERGEQQQLADLLRVVVATAAEIEPQDLDVKEDTDDDESGRAAAGR